MDLAVFAARFIACVALLYATVGQAGETAFLAMMGFALFPTDQMQATALVPNTVAAGYATVCLYKGGAIEGGLLVLGGRIYLGNCSPRLITPSA